MNHRLKTTEIDKRFVYCSATAQLGPRQVCRSHSDTPHSVRLLRTSDRPVVETSSRETQHSKQTDIHAPGGIRISNPSKPAAANPRLRSSGHWNRQEHALAIPNIRVKKHSNKFTECVYFFLFESWFVSVHVVLVSCGTQLEYILNSNRRFVSCYSNTGRCLNKIKETGAIYENDQQDATV